MSGYSRLNICVVEDQEQDYLDIEASVRHVCAAAGWAAEEAGHSPGQRSYRVRRAKDLSTARTMMDDYAASLEPLLIIFDLRIARVDPQAGLVDDFIARLGSQEDGPLRDACMIVYSFIHESRFTSALREFIKTGRPRIAVVHKFAPRSELRAAIRRCLDRQIGDGEER